MVKASGAVNHGIIRRHAAAGLIGVEDHRLEICDVFDVPDFCRCRASPAR